MYIKAFHLTIYTDLQVDNEACLDSRNSSTVYEEYILNMFLVPL
jgi:hypothetical protein